MTITDDMVQRALEAWFSGPVLDRDEKQMQADMRAALTSALEGSVAVPAWQPIETAPKDGSPIIGWSDEGVSYVCWLTKGHWCFFKNYRGDEWYFEPTKWQPHPAFPRQDRAAPGMRSAEGES